MFIHFRIFPVVRFVSTKTTRTGNLMMRQTHTHGWNLSLCDSHFFLRLFLRVLYISILSDVKSETVSGALARLFDSTIYGFICVFMWTSLVFTCFKENSKFRYSLLSSKRESDTTIAIGKVCASNLVYLISFFMGFSFDFSVGAGRRPNVATHFYQNI